MFRKYTIQQVTSRYLFTNPNGYKLSRPCFPALSTAYVLSRPLQRSHVFPRFLPVKCFPTLYTGYIFPTPFTRLMFSRSFRRLHVFPPFAQATSSPVISNVGIFSRPFLRLAVLLHKLLIPCFTCSSHLLTNTMCNSTFNNWLQRAVTNIAIEFTCNHRQTLLLKSPKYLPSTF